MEPGGAGGAENPIPEDDEFQDDDEEFEDDDEEEEFEDDDEEEEFEDDDEEDLDDVEDPEETVINQSPTPVEQWQGEDEGEGEDEQQQQQHQQTGYYPPSFQQRLQAGVPAQEALRGAELAADLLEAAGVGDLEVLYLGEPLNFNDLNVPNVHPPPPPPPPRGLDEDLDDDDDDLDDDEDLDEEPEPEVIDLHEEIDQDDAEIDHHMDGDEGVAELDQPIGYVEIDLVQDEGAAEPEPEPEPEPEDELPPEPEDELPPVELDQPMGDIEIDLIDLEQDEGGAVSEEPEVELAPPPPPRVPTNPRPFLHMLVGRNVSVRLKWGQVYRGILKSTDAYMNLELQGSIQESVVPGSEPTILGDILIRHNNVMYIREI